MSRAVFSQAANHCFARADQQEEGTERSPRTLGHGRGAQQALLHRQQWGKTCIEKDQAPSFETSNFCLEIYITIISTQACNKNIETAWGIL